METTTTQRDAALADFNEARRLILDPDGVRTLDGPDGYPSVQPKDKYTNDNPANDIWNYAPMKCGAPGQTKSCICVGQQPPVPRGECYLPNPATGRCCKTCCVSRSWGIDFGSPGCYNNCITREQQKAQQQYQNAVDKANNAKALMTPVPGNARQIHATLNEAEEKERTALRECGKKVVPP